MECLGRSSGEKAVTVPHQPGMNRIYGDEYVKYVSLRSSKLVNKIAGGDWRGGCYGGFAEKAVSGIRP